MSPGSEELGRTSGNPGGQGASTKEVNQSAEPWIETFNRARARVRICLGALLSFLVVSMTGLVVTLILYGLSTPVSTGSDIMFGAEQVMLGLGAVVLVVLVTQAIRLERASSKITTLTLRDHCGGPECLRSIHYNAAWSLWVHGDGSRACAGERKPSG